jgi:hypothetical protein
MLENQKGNVLMIILLAVALIAALTFAITRDGGGQQVNQLSAAQASLYADRLISHATSARMTIDQMNQWGTDYDEMLFDTPTDSGYASDTGRQVYHPSGGGLSVFKVQDDYFDGNGTTGWEFQRNVNVGWSGSGATDLIYSFINVNDAICAAINKKMIKDDTVPTATVDFVETFTESTTDSPFIAGECADCEDRMSLCITDGTTNAFYNILGSR